MKFSVAGIFLAIVTATLSGIGDPRPPTDSSTGAVAIYDPDPSHIWNRLHATFFVREDLPETASLPDALDPPLWYHTTYLLTEPSHKNALRVLDEFLEMHAENLIHDPVKRALLQRDLWAVFDWSAGRAPGSKQESAEEEKRELQGRLGEVLDRLALTPAQLAALPDNYAQAVASGVFAKEYDPEHRDRAFLRRTCLKRKVAGSNSRAAENLCRWPSSMIPFSPGAPAFWCSCGFRGDAKPPSTI
jgi:hypothetical protein